MPYRHLPYETINNSERRKLFHHADMYLHDVYGMFKLPEAVDGDGGGCGFSIALVLLCVIDGLAAEVYPTRSVKDDEQRFKQFVRDKLGSHGTWRDTDSGNAAKLLYTQLRNPLVHELGGNRYGPTRQEKYDLAEPVIGKWGLIPKDNWDIALFDTLDEWSAQWPVLFRHESKEGPCTKLCCAALYRAVKQTAMDLIIEENRKA